MLIIYKPSKTLAITRVSASSVLRGVSLSEYNKALAKYVDSLKRRLVSALTDLPVGEEEYERGHIIVAVPDNYTPE